MYTVLRLPLLLYAKGSRLVVLKNQSYQAGALIPLKQIPRVDLPSKYALD